MACIMHYRVHVLVIDIYIYIALSRDVYISLSMLIVNSGVLQAARSFARSCTRVYACVKRVCGLDIAQSAAPLGISYI